jgi:hypothetical protein
MIGSQTVRLRMGQSAIMLVYLVTDSVPFSEPGRG